MGTGGRRPADHGHQREAEQGHGTSERTRCGGRHDAEGTGRAHRSRARSTPRHRPTAPDGER
ncbi:MAG: hypothetical protein U5R31_04185 [Acidimicrobiia bacterium]|nr:hypothetical protein [Acidimicrobiia bacterium]